MTKYEKAHTKYRQSTKEKIRRERESYWERKGGCCLNKKAAVTSSSR